ncbi:MAG: DUF4956 domain-containing protein [Flavobacteriaceae bacterium]|nr:DUF4956 domain-containing protein [Flavobacteriaceae bacterium]
MEFFDIPVFDNDVYTMLFRFSLNIVTLTIIIRFLYYKYTGKQNYLFTYYMIGIIVFLICFTLKKFELNLGMALGLFAIFGILRYRTTIEIKEMTYLFIVIGISVINSLANQKMSLVELLLGNLIVIISIISIERVWLSRKLVSKKIIYGNLEHVKPQDSQHLQNELEEKLGFPIQRLEVNDINFFENTVKLTVFYYKNQAKNA